MTHKPILCLDFDGVLHSYASGWKGADVIPDPPVPGAMAFLQEAVTHFRVCIFSSRSHQSGGVKAMRKWLREHFAEHIIDYESKELAQAVALAFVEDYIEFPLEKPAAMITIDDRAITFTGVWPSIETLLAFKPWNKQ